MSGGWRLLLIAAGAVAAGVLFLVLRDDDGTSPARPAPSAVVDAGEAAPPPPPVEIRIPTSTNAIRRATIARGRQVVLVVSGSAGEEVHVHGYDVRGDIGANGVVRLSFRATIPGRFEVELEGSHRQVADLTVR